LLNKFYIASLQPKTVNIGNRPKACRDITPMRRQKQSGEMNLCVRSEVPADGRHIFVY